MISIADLIAPHAAASFPKECCGFVLEVNGTVSLLPCENVHPRPEESFMISPLKVHEAHSTGKILGVYHSHPNDSAELSSADIQFSEESKMTYYVLAYPSRELAVYAPKGAHTELLGRRFVYGTFDCYTLARDYYMQKLGINLGAVKYEPKWWWMREANEHLYLSRMREQGFSIVSDLRPHDLIAVQIEANIPNHLIVFTGDGQGIHHLANRNSELVNYGGMWEKNTRYILRHKDLA